MLAHSIFQYPSKDGQLAQANQALFNKNSIKNLTAQFMLNETEIISNLISDEKMSLLDQHHQQSRDLEKAYSIQKRKTLSDSNLFRSSSACYDLSSFRKQQSVLHKNNDEIDQFRATKLIKSEMRDTNIKEPIDFANPFKSDISHQLPNQGTNLHQSVLRIDSSTNTNESILNSIYS